jgi:hypothetical protein
MATTRQVEGKLRELMRRLDRADGSTHGSLADALPDGRVIEIHLSDLEQTYWTEMAGGRMSGLKRGSAPRSDIRIKLSGDHLVELVDGRASLFSSYVGGRVKIEGSFTDLMRLRKLA